MLRSLLQRNVSLIKPHVRRIAVQSFGGKVSDAFSYIPAEELKLHEQVKLRGRRFLPGADKESFPSFLEGPRDDFPLALKADGNHSLGDWGKYCRKELDENLLKYGAVLFRQLPLSSIEDFQQLYKSIGYPAMNYVGGSAHRENISSEVYSASDEPPECCIDLHNEMSYSPSFNKKFFFFCLIPPEKGGESVICRNNDLFNQLDKRFIEKIESKRIRYVRNCPDQGASNYLSWQTVFESDDREVAEMRMKELGFEWEWSDDNEMLTFWYLMDPFAIHPISGEKIWFNQAHAMHSSYFKAHPSFVNANVEDNMYPLHCTYGDGEEIEPEYLQQVRDAGWSSAVGIPWKKGDVMVLDNMLVQHARLSFEGKRKIVVALSN